MKAKNRQEKMAYDLIYKGLLVQTHQKVASLQEAAETISKSGNNPDYYTIQNNFTGIEISYREIQHYFN